MKIGIKSPELAQRSVVGPIAPVESKIPGTIERLGQTLEGPVANAVASIQDAADDDRVSVEMQAIHAWKDEYVDKPQTGYLAREGMTAKGISEEAIKRFDAVVEERAKGLANERQRQKFKAKVDAQRLSLNDVLMNHEGNQIGKATDAAIAGSIYNAKQDGARAAAFGALNSPDTLATIANHRVELFDALDRRRQQQGLTWEDPAMKAAVVAEVTGFHTQILDQLLVKERYTEAATYLMSNQQEIEGKALNAYQESIKKQSRAAEDVVLTDNAFSAAAKEATGAGPRGRFDKPAAMRAFEANTPPEVRARVREQVEHRINLRQQEQEASDIQSIARLGKLIEQTRAFPEGNPDYDALDDKGQYAVMEMWRRSLRAAKGDDAAARQEQNDINATAVDDAKALAALDPEAFARMTDEELQAKFPGIGGQSPLAQRGWSRVKLVQAQTEKMIRNGSLVHFGAFRAHVAVAMAGMKGKTTKDNITAFQDDMYARFAAQENGVPPTEKEVAEWMTPYLSIYKVPMTVLGPVFGIQTDKPGFKLKPEERAKAPLSEDQSKSRARTAPENEAEKRRQQRAAEPKDPYAEHRKKLPPGYKLVRRGNSVKGGATLAPGDEEI